MRTADTGSALPMTENMASSFAPPKNATAGAIWESSTSCSIRTLGEVSSIRLTLAPMLLASLSNSPSGRTPSSPPDPGSGPASPESDSSRSPRYHLPLQNYETVMGRCMAGAGETLLET
ncbi:hypothetical protein FIBSPDRAFT_422137 [Athelia psychrophila]|uniref:Uncharacterized protein n=1 Tax=Athelia psychrophila TaxID=1759441 RepID=A0A166MVR2_9AGAM|nr:hypothetical protein FIBSPDRAFT_422137 [Fibularhizoctonia sp. CBS 109695]